MTNLQATGANAAQIEFWNGQAAAGWVEHQQHMDALLEPLSVAALQRAAIKSGERVLDVGCGCGATSLAMACAGAQVTGVDISAPMLERARQLASAANLQATFVLADAADHHFAAAYDVLFSRFGVMFFADPIAAFTKLRTALVDGGRVTFVCWQAARDNAWMSLPATAIAALVPPAPPIDPRAPGPFAFADRAYLDGVLRQSGFVDVAVESVEVDLQLGASVDEAMLFTASVGPLSRSLATMEGETKARALVALRNLLGQHLYEGAVRLGARCWVVAARRGT